jgi:metal-dependent amidase/aminoacylase/carboxypeptidase family protein
VIHRRAFLEIPLALGYNKQYMVKSRSLLMNAGPGLATEELKAAVIGEIDKHSQRLGELSRKIHDHPEIAFQEFKAAAWLTEYLEESGFSVERGICGLPTAFQGSYGSGGPVIALLAEYDALPGIGHGCGHNLIAAAAVGAGLACRQVVDRLGGSIRVVGTPRSPTGVKP